MKTEALDECIQEQRRNELAGLWGLEVSSCAPRGEWYSNRYEFKDIKLDGCTRLSLQLY